MNEDVFVPCVHCAEEHPEGVLEAGYCPACLDDGDPEDYECVASVLDHCEYVGCIPFRRKVVTTETWERAK